jgi:serine/threonine-protein kinase
VAAAPAAYGAFSVSPDGTRLAATINASGLNQVWVYDLTRDLSTRVTFDEDGVDANYPTWTPDGSRIAFGSPLSWKRADGVGAVERLDKNASRRPRAFTPDGTTLVFDTTGVGVGMLSLEQERTASMVLDGKFDERNSALSADGRWLAYQSDETGRSEVYVRPFPDVDQGKWQVSTDGGGWPVWNPAGDELFYQSLTGVMVLAFETEPTFTPGALTQLFARDFSGEDERQMAVSPDGRRVLLLRNLAGADADPGERSQLVVVQNFFTELERLVPTK